MTFTEEVQLLLDSHAEIAVKQPAAIKLLNSVHKALFGSNVKQGCGDCNYKAFTAIQKYLHLQNQKQNFNLENMVKFKDRVFVIKEGKVLSMPGQDLTNDNLTDEKAIDLLTRYPNLVKHFQKYPGSDAIPPALDLSLLANKAAHIVPPAPPVIKPAVTAKTKDAIIAEKVATPPHKRKGLKEMAAMLPGETTAQYADRVGVTERSVFRYVAAGTLPNYDPETKAGKVEAAEVAPVIVAPETKPEKSTEAEAGKTLRDLLTPDGMLRLELNYDLSEIEADIAEMEEADKDADTLQVAQFFNGEIVDEAEAAEIAGQLAVYLKSVVAIEGENKASEAIEGKDNTSAAASGESSTQPGADPAATV